MDSSFQDLLKRLDHLSDQFQELKEGVHKAADIASRDPEMALTRARKVLEYVVRDVYERRCSEPPGTRPLENLIQRLVKDGHFPDRLNAYANTVRMLGNVGTHTFDEKVTAADVYQSLTQLMPILEWYFEVERPEALGQKPEQRQPTVSARVQSVVPAAAGNIAVVPKGLRSFDAQDADFFLDLLPGPRDKHGLPESIRFWKHRIEATDELTFTVGVIYGPSGCGKSSLVKAGLLPRLAAQVLPVYVEATGADTEVRLLKGFRKRCPNLSGDLDLIGTIAALRQGQGLSKGQKVFIVLDQFEQWLHATKTGENTELTRALRQCDGEHVQCVVLVRDDFWMGLTRFLQDLQIELLQGQNCAAVDLFDPIHARNVLAAFGRAFGRLEPDPAKEQELFLDQAIQGLSQDGRVICVRLALFAEMMKGKPWTPATLKEVGGTEGVGVTFLEETFSATSAPPQHRRHQKAAQAVLKALLPDSGAAIRGHMRSYTELLLASGYANRPKDFADLIRILDSDIRLITPTDPEGKDRTVDDASPVQAGQQYYQLTHDYLLPSLLTWLTRMQRETRRGQASLLLADRAQVWNARPTNRQLPSFFQWISISILTQKESWTKPQWKMMRRATRYHVVRGLLMLALALVVGTVAGVAVRDRVVEQGKATHAAGLVQRLFNADTAQVPAIIGEMADYRRWADPLLREENDKAAANSRKKLHASLALLPVDAMQVDYLYGRLLDAAPHEVPVIRDALAPHGAGLVERLWLVVEKPEKGKKPQRLRAAAALAKYDPEGERWATANTPVVKDLVLENPIFLGQWSEAFRPVRNQFVAPLSVIFRDHQSERTAERSLATNLLADYASDNPQVLADLLMEADEKQFAVMYTKFKEHGERDLPVLTAEIDKRLSPDLPASHERREKLAKRQANAAVVLLRMNQPAKVWFLLKHTPDPRVRSYLIHRLSPLGADAEAIIKRLDEEPDLSIRRALLLCLGEFGEEELPLEVRTALVPKLQDIYRTAADPGLHASAEWLLRQWQRESWLRQVDEEWAKDQEGRGKHLTGIKMNLTSRTASASGVPPQWYVNGQSQTMVVIPGPVEFLMGSPLAEEGREKDESQHRKRIIRTFAVDAKAVTVEQYRRFDKGYQIQPKYSRTADSPVVGTSWYQAAAYCNWLSKQEGIDNDQLCYETDDTGKVTKLRANYLSLTGYRLPTEAEMEYAARAGAVTSRFYGESDELLGKYSVYRANSQEVTWPVGNLKPNDLGFFDVQGNVYTWCQESYKVDPEGGKAEAIDDREDDVLAVSSSRSRVLRGGSFYNPASIVRSAYRYFNVPASRLNNSGFRPARTFSP